MLSAQLIKKNIFIFYLTIIPLIFLTNCKAQPDSVKTVVDDLVSNLYESMDEDELNHLTTSKIMSMLSDSEKKILAEKHWMFNCNVPVEVFIMRDKNQAEVPFWLKEGKWTNTGMLAKNEYNTYQVWKSKFDAGRVNLGINGFDKHRPHYFVAVMPQDRSDSLTLSGFFPENQYVCELDTGAFTYHDWDELVLTDVPKELLGAKLLTTIRGRAREAHLLKAFRKTEYPSSIKPDQIMLTWSDNPELSQSVQWRTNLENGNGAVRYWEAGENGEEEYIEVAAERIAVEDRLLLNDRFVYRYTANIDNLAPSTKYEYIVGNPDLNIWSNKGEFITASQNDTPFSFVYFGDTHKSPHWGKLINDAYLRFPNSAFYTIGGDIVSTGLHRDEWDRVFEYSKKIIKNKPLMPTLGNHDSQDGLGYWMYSELFDLPKNGSKNIPSEGSYSFKYNNAKFIMLDVTSSIEAQTEWLEEQLQNSDAKWKFALFHFPPYSYEEDYPTIREEWCALFDKYHVDMVFTGHVHYYMRSKPMYNQRPVKSMADGTVYIISIAIPNRIREMEEREFVDVRFAGDYLYQTISIDGDKLEYRAINQDGIVKDSFSINK